MPNLTIGHPVIASLRKHSSAFFDCHLMVSQPAQWVQVRGGPALPYLSHDGGHMQALWQAARRQCLAIVQGAARA